MKEDGCTKVELTNDKEVYGAGLANNIDLAAKARAWRSSPTTRSTRVSTA